MTRFGGTDSLKPQTPSGARPSPEETRRPRAPFRFSTLVRESFLRERNIRFNVTQVVPVRFLGGPQRAVVYPDGSLCARGPKERPGRDADPRGPQAPSGTSGRGKFGNRRVSDWFLFYTRGKWPRTTKRSCRSLLPKDFVPLRKSPRSRRAGRGLAAEAQHEVCLQTRHSVQTDRPLVSAGPLISNSI